MNLQPMESLTGLLHRHGLQSSEKLVDAHGKSHGKSHGAWVFLNLLESMKITSNNHPDHPDHHIIISSKCQIASSNPLDTSSEIPCQDRIVIYLIWSNQWLPIKQPHLWNPLFFPPQFGFEKMEGLGCVGVGLSCEGLL